jgi:integrase
MSALPSHPDVLATPGGHAPRTIYAAFLQRSALTPASQDTYLDQYEAFVRHYPDLKVWLQAPLVERVGRIVHHGQAIVTCRCAYKARPYLLFLALHGYLPLDWSWLLAVPRLRIEGLFERLGVQAVIRQWMDEAVALGYQPVVVRQAIPWGLSRLLLHAGHHDPARVSATDVTNLRAAVRAFSDHPEVAQLYGSVEQYRQVIQKSRLSEVHLLEVVLYHRGQSSTEPRKCMPVTAREPLPKPRMEAVLARYLTARRLTDRPSTIARLDTSLRRFICWITEQDPAIESFAEVTREHVLIFAEALTSMVDPQTGQPFALLTRRGYLACLSVFFRDVAAWEWPEVPTHPLLAVGDLPRIPQRVPRYIPDDELERLMAAVRALPCPYQRAALLVARWSGARRDEIRRLEVGCLDQYPDGTPRLRIPAGKTKQERLVPVHPEAAEAIREVQALRSQARGLRDDLTGTVTHYLFLHHGKLFSATYLFDTALKTACEAAGLVGPDGRPTITAHRFRHTVGTQLAEHGAKLHTIMRILGHTSPSMSLVYAQISDKEVRADYERVLGPGAIIAGPCAESLRTGTLSAAAIDWLKTNFFKTELELGHCLRLPQEGPCECDLYLTCAKFVTTPEYAPRLRARRRVEQLLIADALARGWEREVERHRRVIARVEQLLTDLGETLEEGAPPMGEYENLFGCEVST